MEKKIYSISERVNDYYLRYVPDITDMVLEDLKRKMITELPEGVPLVIETDTEYQSDGSAICRVTAKVV